MERLRSFLNAFILTMGACAVLRASEEGVRRLETSEDVTVAEMGTLRMGEMRRHVFALESPSDAPVRVTAVESSCECLIVLHYPPVVVPGEPADLLVELRPDKPGEYAYAAAVQFADDRETQRFFITSVTVVGPPHPGRRNHGQRRGPDPPPPRVPRPREMELYRRLAEVESDIRQGTIRVVDVREEAAFRRGTLPHVLNIQAQTAKARGFLRRGPVLLVDDGWGAPETERACRALREAGNASCWILHGGVNLWLRRGHPLQGTDVGGDRALHMSARDYLSVRGFEDWTVLSVGGTNALHWLPEAVPVEEVLKAPSADGEGRLLLVNANNQPVGADLPVDWNGPAFWLEGGAPALEAQLHMMTAMRHRNTRRTAPRIAGARWRSILEGCRCP